MSLEQQEELQGVEVCSEEAIKAQSQRHFLGLNLLGFRAETQHGAAAAVTGPPLPEEEETGEQEAEDPSAGS